MYNKDYLEPKLSQSQLLKNTLHLLLPHKLLTAATLLFIIVSSISIMFVPYFIKEIVDTIQSIESPIKSIMPLIAVALTGAFCGMSANLLSTYLIQKVILSLRQKVVVHSLQQSMDYYNKEPLGRIVTRITKDLDETNVFFHSVIINILESIISLVTVTTMLYILNPYLLLSTLLTIPLIFLLVQFYRKKIVTASQKERSQISLVNTYLSEHLQGLLDIQLYNKTEESIANFTKHNNEHFRRDYQLGIYQMYIRPTLSLILNLMIAIICVVGALLANYALITIGTLFAFIQLIESFFSPIITLAQVSAQIQASLVSIERIFSFLEVKTALTNLRTTSITQQKLLAQLDVPQSTLAFEQVSFAYNAGNNVIENINFELKPGKKTALVGHSGSGKTTITRLCMRFWDTSEGKVLYNGINIKDIPLELLRTKIVLLEQDSFIFNDTIKENISMGREIDQETLNSIASNTGLDKLINSYDDGWDHIVTKNTISTGEQRLIAISRVLVKAPTFIILDEFSATLDNQTEQVIQELLEKLQHNRGSLIIAHRLNTILQCDEILYIEDGKIKERGTHKELLALNGGYAQLITNMNKMATDR